MQEIVNTINAYIWSSVFIGICLFAGLFYSIFTRFVQVRQFSEMLRLLFAGNVSKQGVSSFQALTISLSGRVGTGNIAGVAAAIGFGGPGAVFWMWLVAFLGAATAYIESTLGQIYKQEYEGQYRGGPAYYIEKVLGEKKMGIALASVFAVATIIATGLLLPGVQSNSIGNAVELAFGPGTMVNTSFFGEISLAKIGVGTAVIIVLGFIIFGGVKRIAQFTQVVVPFMALGYIVIALVIIGLNIDKLPGIFMLIIGDAFSPMAGFGAAIGWGVKRGIYSNEAGQGTGPHAAAAAEVQHPAQQGLVQSFSVYVDTLFVCSATALMILITGAYNVYGIAEGPLLVQNLAPTVDANSPAFTQYAIEKVFPGLGSIFVAFALMFFSFTTILAYYYIAETNVVYLTRKVNSAVYLVLLKIGLMSSTFYGAIKAASLAWGMGDIGVGLMAWLNIIALFIIFFVSKPAILALKDYERQQRLGGKNYSFDPENLGIKNADFWVKRLAKTKAQTETDTREAT